MIFYYEFYTKNDVFFLNAFKHIRCNVSQNETRLQTSMQ